MKANEAPEKLYISYKGYGVFSEDGSTERTKISQIEYTRTDAFIEKADEFISTFFHPDDTELIDTVLNRFHKHIKLK